MVQIKYIHKHLKLVSVLILAMTMAILTAKYAQMVQSHPLMENHVSVHYPHNSGIAQQTYAKIDVQQHNNGKLL